MRIKLTLFYSLLLFLASIPSEEDNVKSGVQQLITP